jgi:CRP/FNR family nitrogen fixation transcriptional regulator
MGIAVMQAHALAHALATAGSFPPPLAPPESDSEVRLIGATRTYGRDQEIFGEGDPADCVYQVVSGAVRAFRVLTDGRRQIADFYLPGDVFGIELGNERRSAAEALGETVVVVARRQTLMAEPEEGARLWRLALCQLQRSQDHVLTLGRRSALERVASFLVDMAERLDADREFDLPMSRQDMADFLGLTIETVSRTLTQLQADGLIAFSGCRRVRLARPTALAELCE